jgi:hypothetical protein
MSNYVLDLSTGHFSNASRILEIINTCDQQLGA